jgi:hypothetical protein
MLGLARRAVQWSRSGWAAAAGASKAVGPTRVRPATAALSAAALVAGFAAAFADDGEMVVFSGNANPELAQEIAVLLKTKLGDVTVGRFSDGEVNVQVNENVRGKDVYIVQPTCSPVNEHL